jgi:hypothetical protein
MPRELRPRPPGSSVNPRRTFHDQLVASRQASGLSLRALAERTSQITKRRIHYQRIYLLERGLQPRPDEVWVLAAALGAAVADRIKTAGGAHDAA